MRDLTDEPADVVAAERARVATEGWGARLLALQGDDGQWGGGTDSPKWISTTYTLLLRRLLGIDPASAEARAAVQRVRDDVRWQRRSRAPTHAPRKDSLRDGGRRRRAEPLEDPPRPAGASVVRRRVGPLTIAALARV